jgi:hypothetical protein
MQNFIILFFIIFISSCTSPIQSQQKYFLNENDLKHLADYKYRDTIIFSSNLGNIDTIIVSAIGYEDFRSINYLGNRVDSIFGKSIAIQFFPIDKCLDTLPEDDPGKDFVNSQRLIHVQKSQKTNKPLYLITFKDFISKIDSVLGTYHTDSININGNWITNYYLVEPQESNKPKKSKSIITVYWTDKSGLTAYTNREGESWTILK